MIACTEELDGVAVVGECVENDTKEESEVVLVPYLGVVTVEEGPKERSVSDDSIAVDVEEVM